MPSPIITRNFYILPINDGEEMSLRIELHGCGKGLITSTTASSSTKAPQTTTPFVKETTTTVVVTATAPIKVTEEPGKNCICAY